MVTKEPPRPPICTDCPIVIDSEDVLWDGYCPTFPTVGHTLELEGLNQLWTYLQETQSGN